MQPIPLVRASSVLPLFAFLAGGGAACRSLRERAQPAFRGPEALLPVAWAGSLFAEAARVTGDEAIGLRIGRETKTESFGEWGALIARSPTVGGFFQNALASYRHFNTGYRLWTVSRADDVWLHLSYTRALRQGRAQALEFSLSMWLAVFRSMIGPAWRPTAVHLEGDPPQHARAIEELAGCPVVFGQPMLAIVFPRGLLAHRITARSLAAFPRPSAIDPASDFAGSARQTAASLLRLGTPDLSVAAAAAGMSERSFQRHLGEIGLTFSKLIENARFEAARQLLSDPAVRVIDVSTELGYHDAANFTRAFRRWSGVSPQRFRRVAATPASFAATPAS